QDHGSNPTKGQVVEITCPEMLAALIHRQVDAAAESEPFVTIGRSMGTRSIGDYLTADHTPTLVGTLIALRPWAQSHQGLLRQFARAYDRGEQWADAHTAQASRYLVTYAHVRPSLVSKLHLPVIGKIGAGDLSYWVRLG